MNKLRYFTRALACSALAGVVSLAYAGDREDDRDFKIEVLSSKPYMVSGGDALVRVTVKDRKISMSGVRIELNNRNVTAAFRADAGARTFTGLVSGMREGRNKLEVEAKGGKADLTLTNYPIEGPIISGPHQFPYACTTQNFVPVSGAPALGTPLDSNCSVERRVHYAYRTTQTGQGVPQFKLLQQPYSSLPSDLATTTINGVTLPFIVRLETGTINRAIYQTAILHNPNDGTTPSPFSPPANWNGRLVYPLGGGCIGGWYFQGDGLVTPLNATWLGKGHAVASASLNTFGNNCNDLLSSETIVMVKERFIESYGVPKFTIGTGSSGGAYQSNQTGDNYPGTFDGIVTMSSFPDVTTGMIPMHSSRLLELYFAANPTRYDTAKKMAITGYLSIPGQINEMSRVRGDRMDPRIAFPDEITTGVGPQYRYDPVTNPYGARGDVYDHTVNVYGLIRNTPEPGAAKFAQRPLDNVGVQYGLKAMNDGKISVDDFLHLNENIGGVDIDFNRVATRTRTYPAATRRAYEGGRILSGGAGLASTAIITRMGGGDLDPDGDVHLRYHAHAIRARLVNANGHANNQAIVGNLAPSELLLDQMGQWLTAVVADTSNRSRAEKVVANRPGGPDGVVDACWIGGVKVVETQTLSGGGRCNQEFPVGVPPEYVAGAPIALDIIKCKRKAVDMADYKVAFTPQQRAKVHAIFREGVCDWSKPGHYQVNSVPWASFGPSPVNQLFDLEDRRDD